MNKSRRYKYKKEFPDWTANLAYAVGVIATDGNLSSSGRHINVTSKDLEMVLTIKNILGLANKIGKKARGYSTDKKYFVLQFGDVCLYDFLLSIGLTQAKSKTLSALHIPARYFADFFRGCVDGDGNIDVFSHPESQKLQHRVRLVSASRAFLEWILQSVREDMSINGGWICSNGRSMQALAFGKEDSRKLLKAMYYKKSLPSLSRKRAVAEQILSGE